MLNGTDRCNLLFYVILKASTMDNYLVKLTLCTAVGDVRREFALIPSKVDLKKAGTWTYLLICMVTFSCSCNCSGYKTSSECRRETVCVENAFYFTLYFIF